MDVEIDKYTKIILYVIDGDYGLPSADPFSMEMLLNIKLNNCSRIEIRKSRMNANADLPKLVVNGTTFSHPEQIRKIIEKITRNKINQEYSKMELSRLSAYFAHGERFMSTAALMNSWAIEENAILSAGIYAKGMWFPFGAFYGRNQRKKMDECIELIVGKDELKTFIEMKYSEVDAYFKDLSNLLGNKRYVLGDHPTTLDLYLCSYLAPAFRFSYPNTQFFNIINANVNVSDYVRNFLKRHAPLKEPIDREVPVENDRASAVMLIGAGITAIAAMSLFAWSHGILRNH